MAERDGRAGPHGCREVLEWRKRFNHGNGQKQWPHDPITDVQLDYIFDELEYEASQRDPATGIFVTSIPKVYESRSLIPADLKSAHVSGAAILESAPDEEKDWHPGSDGQVLDLVHPSLYCLRIGESLVRLRADTDTASTNALRVIDEKEYMSLRPDLNDFLYCSSVEYQWLPTDFEVSELAEVKAFDYINNLHPIQHRSLCPTISSIHSRFIPLFERVLSDTLSPERPLPSRSIHTHDPASFSPPNTDGRVDFKLCGRTLQVIVKLANIVLTPENPCYSGGSWHVEGMANEKIVATGLYYYGCENTTESRLNFRTVVGDGEDNGRGMPYEQNDDRGYYTAYGFSGDDPLNQELGHVIAEEDKKILCFFLVDPLTRILSTSDVPPQQSDWALQEMLRIPALQELPVELFEIIAGYVTSGTTVPRKEAEEHRERLMDERVYSTMGHNEEVFELDFNMCEH
ncbi:hypothetical protein BV20DRAFT_1055109 [Pilatotrama ljubarskyi]|nr:hypothetical protein BV20DRAFT_1055109 [Pilatotrama ljubarskyi]